MLICDRGTWSCGKLFSANQFAEVKKCVFVSGMFLVEQ
jgi:hypothetical protein